MTTYSKNGPHGLKHTTCLYLIYLIKDDGELRTLGLYETEEAAQEDIASIKHAGWMIREVRCFGWGIVDGVVMRNVSEKPAWGELYREQIEQLPANFQSVVLKRKDRPID